MDSVNPQHNTYFCVSSFTGTRRRKSEFVALHCLVIDDVGTKVEPATVVEQLGNILPTWELETSPGNFQWGYLFDEPLKSFARAERLINATVDAVAGGEDPGMKSVSRYVRLPEGRNWKAKHEGFKHRMKWDSDGFVSVECLEDVLGITGDAEEQASEHPEALDFGDDVMGLQLLNAGRMKSRLREGVYDITCPWVDHHTDKEDTGTAYLSPDGFKCHHGHCERKTFLDLQVSLGAPTLSEYQQASPALWDFSTVVPREDVPREVELLGSPTAEEWLKGGDIACWFGEDGKMTKPPPREWVLKDMLCRNSVAVLGGEGGVGKGKLLVNLCIALATGTAWGPFNPMGKTYKVVYVGKEDNRDEQRRRFFNALQQWNDQGLDVDQELLMKNLVIPELNPLLVLGEELRDAVSGTGADLLIIDPLMRFMEKDVSLNSQEGAGWVHNGLGLIQQANPGSCVLVVHHLNKPGRDGGPMHVSQLTGSAGITDLARMAMQMMEVDPVRKAAMGVHPARRVIEGAVTKSNYGPKTMIPWTFEMLGGAAEGAIVPLAVQPHHAGGLKVVEILCNTGMELTTPELDAHLTAAGMSSRQRRAAKQEARDKLGVEVLTEGRRKPVWALDDLGGIF